MPTNYTEADIKAEINKKLKERNLKNHTFQYILTAIENPTGNTGLLKSHLCELLGTELYNEAKHYYKAL